MDPRLTNPSSLPPEDPRLVGNRPPEPVQEVAAFDPPDDLKGTYGRCGNCNAYLAGDRCPQCAPVTVPNVVNL